MQLFIPLVMMQSFLPDLQSSVGVLASMRESRDNPIPASEGGDGPRGRSPEESSAGVAALPYQLSDQAWRLLVLVLTEGSVLPPKCTWSGAGPPHTGQEIQRLAGRRFFFMIPPRLSWSTSSSSPSSSSSSSSSFTRSPYINS